MPTAPVAPLAWSDRPGRKDITNKEERHTMFTSAIANGTTCIHYFDGGETVTIYHDGSLSWRAHNPGLIGYGLFGCEHGAIGNIHGRAAFRDKASGRAALVAMLGEPSLSAYTVEQAMRQFVPHYTVPPAAPGTPPPPGVAPGTAPARICPEIGLPAERPMSETGRADRERMAEAIEALIGYTPGFITTERLEDLGRDRPTPPAPHPNGIVLINGRSAVHAGSGGMYRGPDVCNTPDGEGCSPVLYSNVARSEHAEHTASSVKIHGHPACHAKSIFSHSSGDEAGRCGGVASGTTRGKAEFLTHSPDVFFEGEPAVRQFDLMVSNHRNSAPMPLMQEGGAPVSLDYLQGVLADAADPPTEAGAVELAAAPDSPVHGVIAYREAEGESEAPPTRKALSALRSLAVGSATYQQPHQHDLLLPARSKALATYLRFADERNGSLHIPLGRLATQPQEAIHASRQPRPGQRELALVPLIPLRYTEPTHDKGQAALLRPGGWLYIFRDGHLWRELQVLPQGRLRDVDLSEQAGKDSRRASGEADQAVLVPARVGGAAVRIEIAYAEVQWSWTQINALGGLADDDIRLAHAERRRHRDHPVPRPDAEQKARAAEGRERRLQSVELSGYPQAFPPRAAEGRSAAIESIRHAVAIPLLELLAYSDAPVVYVNDPLGIARGLRRLQQAAESELDLIAASANSGEYALAQLIDSLLASERRTIQQARANHAADIPEARLSERVDTARLEKTLNGWNHYRHRLTDDALNAGRRLLGVLRGEAFHAALGDYFGQPAWELTRRALGLLAWVELAGGLDFPEGRAYVREIADGRMAGYAPIGQPDDALRAYLHKLVAGHAVLRAEALHDGLTASGDDVGLAEAGGKLLESLYEVLAKAQLADGENGLRWIVGYLNDVVGRRAELTHVSLHRLLWLPEREAGELYRYQPRFSAAFVDWTREVSVPWIHLKGVDAPATPAQMERLAQAKQGLVGLLMLTQAINVCLMLHKAIESKRPKDAAALLGALSGAASYYAKVYEPLARTGAEDTAEEAISAKMTRDRAERAYLRAQGTEKEIARSRRLERADASFDEAYKAARRADTLLAWTLRVKLFGALIAGIADTGLGGWDAVGGLAEGNPGEAAGGTVLAASGMAGLYAALAEAGTFAAGAACVPVLGALAALGALVSLVVLAESRRGPLERALNDGWLGRHSYPLDGWRGPYGERPAARAVADAPGLHWVDLTGELEHLFELLFAYEVKLEVLREYIEHFTTPQYEAGTGEVVVRATVRFNQFLPERSTFEPRLTAEGTYGLDEWLYGPRAGVYPASELLIEECKGEGGALRVLRIYRRLPEAAVSGGVVFDYSLDVYGDGRYLIPKNPDKRQARWDPHALFPDRYGGIYRQDYTRVEAEVQSRRARARRWGKPHEDGEPSGDGAR